MTSKKAWDLFLAIQKLPDTPNNERNYIRDSAKKHAEALARELELMESFPENEEKAKR